MICVWVVTKLEGWYESAREDPGDRWAHKELSFLSVPMVGHHVIIGEDAWTVESVSHLPSAQKVAIIVTNPSASNLHDEYLGKLRSLRFDEGLPPWASIYRTAGHAIGLSSSTETRGNATPPPASPGSGSSTPSS